MNAFWWGFIIGGFICGFVGFLSAAILAASGRASRMEERIEDDLFSYQTYNKTPIKEKIESKILTFKSKDVKPYKDFDDKKDTYVVVTKNNPRTD